MKPYVDSGGICAGTTRVVRAISKESTKCQR